MGGSVGFGLGVTHSQASLTLLLPLIPDALLLGPLGPPLLLWGERPSLPSAYAGRGVLRGAGTNQGERWQGNPQGLFPSESRLPPKAAALSQLRAQGHRWPLDRWPSSEGGPG